MNCGFKTLLTLNICYSEVWGVRWSQGNNLSKQPWPGCHLPPLPASLLYWSLIQDSLFCSNYLIILHRAKEATAGDTSFIMTGAGFSFIFSQSSLEILFIIGPGICHQVPTDKQGCNLCQKLIYGCFLVKTLEMHFEIDKTVSACQEIISHINTSLVPTQIIWEKHYCRQKPLQEGVNKTCFLSRLTSSR